MYRQDPNVNHITSHMGPFKVVQVIGKAAYKLELPDRWEIHPVFHVSLLKPFHTGPGRVVPPPPTVIIDGEPEYQVETIQKHREAKRGKRKYYEYLIKWLGYGVEHNTWEPEECLTHCAQLLKQYKRTAGI